STERIDAAGGEAACGTHQRFAGWPLDPPSTAPTILQSDRNPPRKRRYTRIAMSRTQTESWGHSTVRTACPLDCPDSCSLDVTVERGRVVKIDAADANPTTRNFICGKVRRFGERLYGDDRLLYPAVRKGPKGQGTFARVTWDEALDAIAQRMIGIRDTIGAEG